MGKLTSQTLMMRAQQIFRMEKMDQNMIKKKINNKSNFYNSKLPKN